jgi:carbon monoxide dehydrogenase subunit G
MIVVERTFAVTAAPGVVLGYLQDFANAREWDPSVEHTSQVGARQWRHTRRFFGVTAELTYTLVAAEPGCLVFHGRSEGATCTDSVVVRLLPGGGSEVTYRVELEMHGLAKLATPIMKAELEKLAGDSVTAMTAALDGMTAVRRFRLGAEFTRGGKPQMKISPPNRMPTPAEETGWS